GILQPTRNIVELLISYAFAKNFSEDIVVSAIDFYFDDFDAVSSKNRELDDEEMSSSNFYDLSINSTIFVDGDEIIYHNLLENDLLKNGPRKELNGEYFDNLKIVFSKNKDELDELVVELKQELPQVEFGFDEIVGRGEGLSEFMQNMVNVSVVTYEEAIGIKKQLTDEYDAGELSDDNVDQRLISLLVDEPPQFEDFSEFKEVLSDFGSDDEEAEVINEFFNMIGDNEELGNNVLQAILTDDAEYFQNLIINAI
ncbi:MAG: hypothetical protein IJ672_07315, partial [Methanobrevibacter sp.]|nr:hypothetical protein [Methanobrevibacter sp.]